MSQTYEGFVPGTEQFLAAVWYAAKDAERQWAKHQQAQKRGGVIASWWYLRKVRKALDLPEEHVPYSAMRSQLITFAETFGIEGVQR